MGERCLATVVFDFDSVHFDEKAVIMLRRRNSIRRVLEGFMRTFTHPMVSSAYSRASGLKPHFCGLCDVLHPPNPNRE